MTRSCHSLERDRFLLPGDPVHLGARTGMIAVLHTWGQNLSCIRTCTSIVPGGGITAGFWKRARSKGKFLFPVKALSRVMRADGSGACARSSRGRSAALPAALYQSPGWSMPSVLCCPGR